MLHSNASINQEEAATARLKGHRGAKARGTGPLQDYFNSQLGFSTNHWFKEKRVFYALMLQSSKVNTNHKKVALFDVFLAKLKGHL